MAVIVLLPALISLISNIIIFNEVSLSTRRLQLHAESTATNSLIHQTTRANRRDLHLLKHMILMFSVHVCGWTPIYIVAMIDIRNYLFSIVYNVLFVFAAISTLCNIVNLFLYHHEIRRFLLNKIQRLF